MTRSVLRRAGGLFLLMAWMPVATANAAACAAFCLFGTEVAAHSHHHSMGAEHRMAGHHMAGARVSAPQHCGMPDLLVVTCVPPELSAFPSVDVALVDVHVDVATPLLSATPEFATPPPRA
jgi:hypothetical protein